MFELEIVPCLGSMGDDFLRQGAIIRMDARQNHFQSWFLGRIVFKDAICFLRPHKLSFVWIPPETTCATESLCLRQVHVTKLEFLGECNLLCYVNPSAHKIPGDGSATGSTHTTYVPDRAVRPDDALREVE